MANDEIKSLRPGYVVALTLAKGAAPLRSYVGKIMAIDEYGLRLTLVDWFVGMFTSYDLFVSWRNLESAYVCTEEHDLDSFADVAGKWQEAMNKKTIRQHRARRGGFAGGLKSVTVSDLENRLGCKFAFVQFPRRAIVAVLDREIPPAPFLAVPFPYHK